VQPNDKFGYATTLPHCKMLPPDDERKKTMKRGKEIFYCHSSAHEM
jgi:hypothetical protein